MTPDADRLSTRGISVRVLRGGAGPPLLFLHGGGGWPAWSPFFARLAEHYAVCIPEHPGFGASDDPSWLRNVADLAMYYLDFLDEVYATPAHVIGHSLGGWTAAEAAVRNTGRIASLTLLAPAGIRVKGIPPADVFIMSPDEIRTALSYGPTPTAAPAKTEPPSEAQLDIELQNRLAGVKFGWEPRFVDPGLEKWLHRITVPTHVLWGSEDKILPSAYAKVWGERVPGAQVTLIEACGHIPQIEQSHPVADAVIAFLKRVQP